MGILDRIKSAASTITGGGATVTIQPQPLRFDGPFSIGIRVVVGSQDLHTRGIYLRVEGQEDVQIPNVQVRSGDSTHSQTVHQTTMTVRIEYPVDEGRVLQAGSTHDFAVEVTIPDGALPIYEGKLARHVYRAKAGIDLFGNDPDSGWQELRT